MSFQNCAQTPAEDSTESSFESSLPFGYVAKVDTIAYMSCSNMTGNYVPATQRAYFTFRAGAYSSATGGLAMTSDFRTATKYYDATQRSMLFGMSDLNANSYLSLSLRNANDYQQPWVVNSLAAGEELDTMLPLLSTQSVAGVVGNATAGTMVNYFPSTETKRLMEGTLRFYDSESVMVQTRNSVISGKNSGTLLTVSYTDVADETDTALRVPAQEYTTANVATLPTNRAYGVGYQLNFSIAKGFTSNGAQRVLSMGNSITEWDLKTGKSTLSSLDCGSTAIPYQFMVVRPQDKANGLVACTTGPDRYSNTTEMAQLNAIRRVLRVEDWFVDVTNRCIVPKFTTDYCYGDIHYTSALEKTIQYGTAACLEGTTTACPHFVSVCIRP